MKIIIAALFLLLFKINLPQNYLEIKNNFRFMIFKQLFYKKQMPQMFFGKT